jgi:hypothetical protein
MCLWRSLFLPAAALHYQYIVMSRWIWEFRTSGCSGSHGTFLFPGK